MEAISALVFENWYHAFIAMFLFFNLIYWGFSLSAMLAFRYFERKKQLAQVDNHFLYSGQQKIEIFQSMRSIFIFSLQGIVIQQGIANDWLHISTTLSWWLLPQIIILFIWNEVHFYLGHWLLHTKFMMRNVHHVHHHSKEPTVFSTFSFHWVEAFLLGTVIFFPLLIYPFQLWAILSLPIMSLLINLMGHSNYDLFPNHNPEHLLKFSYRHSMHHKRGRGNLGFLLPWLDQLFKTTAK
ncbi:MAG: sterol desaturase family protein [Pelobium sp.]